MVYLAYHIASISLRAINDASALKRRSSIRVPCKTLSLQTPKLRPSNEQRRIRYPPSTKSTLVGYRYSAMNAWSLGTAAVAPTALATSAVCLAEIR